MSRMPRIRGWLSVPAELAQDCWQAPPPPHPLTEPRASPSADTCSAAGGLSFRRIADIPFDACLAALQSWQRTGHDGELHLGQGLLRAGQGRPRLGVPPGSRSAWPAGRCCS